MNFNRRHFVGAAVALTASASTELFAQSTRLPANLLPPSMTAPLPAQARSSPQPALLERARSALDAHSSYIGHRDRVGIVDFAQPSSEKRFQLVNLETGMVEHTLLVAHGKGSDPDNTGYAQRFSNDPGSNASSRGAYCTANAYYGEHGRSRRLIGLDPENSAALQRAIVIHAAAYVDPDWIDQRGRIGRSFGCFAVEDAEIARVLDKMGEGRLLYAGTSA